MNVSLLGSAHDFDVAWRAAWAMENLDEVLGAVAYVSEAGARLLQNCWRTNPTQLRLLCGVEEATQGNALALLVEWRESNTPEKSKVEFAWFAPSRGRFHPKLWFFEAREECRLLIGSSNLTAGGHGNNVESGVLLRFDAGTPFHFAAREIFSDWWKNSISLNSNLARSAKERDDKRSQQKEEDAVGKIWETAVAKEESNGKPAPLPPVALDVEQRVLALLQRGVIVELTVSARNLYEKFEGNPFDISSSQVKASANSDVLKIEQRDSQQFCVLSTEIRKKLSNLQTSAREALKLFSYASVWGDFVPYSVYTSWHQKQNDKRTKYKVEIEQQFNSELFWREERERLRQQIERDSRMTWERLHPKRPKMPEKNLKQVVYEVQRAFDRRYGELSDSVALHYQNRTVNWSELLRGAQGAPTEVSALLQTHARDQSQLLLRDWMRCLIQRTRLDCLEILKARSDKTVYRDAQRLKEMNFFDDAYLRNFVIFIQGPSLFVEEAEQFGDKKTGQTLESWIQRFDSDLETLNSWREMDFAKVLLSFAAMVGWECVTPKIEN